MNEFLAVSALPAFEKFLHISTKKSISVDEISPFGLHNFITLPKLKKIGQKLLNQEILGSFTEPKRRLRSQEEGNLYIKDLARMQITNLRFVPLSQKIQIDRTAFEQEKGEVGRRLWEPLMFIKEERKWQIYSPLIDLHKKLECEWKFTEVVTQLVFRFARMMTPQTELIDTIPDLCFSSDQEWESTKQKTYELEAFKLDFTEKQDIWQGNQIEKDLKEAKMKQVTGKIMHDIQGQIASIGKRNAVSYWRLSQALTQNRKGNFALKPRSLKRIPIMTNRSVAVNIQPESAVKRLVSHMKGNIPKEKATFPFKVGSLVVESLTEQYLLYKSKQINIKTLGKIFLTDRIRFHQNTVKIEIDLHKDNSDRIVSALQMLVNLGADVSCVTARHESQRYSNINDIDIFILAFLSQKPVGEVMKMYN